MVEFEGQQRNDMVGFACERRGKHSETIPWTG